MPHYEEFELDIPEALAYYLPPRINSLTAAPLTAANIAVLPSNVQGIYILLHNNVATYVGKTDSSAGLQSRLSRHLKALSARSNLNLSDVTFKAVRILVFTVMDVETVLIKHYLGQNKNTWQKSGFGSNDPGHNRENQKPANFDVLHPVSINQPLTGLPVGVTSVHKLLLALKNMLPYDFRFETDMDPSGKQSTPLVGHADQRAAPVVLPAAPLTLQALMTNYIKPSMPPGWVFTVFPGRVIYYKALTTYTHAIQQI